MQVTPTTGIAIYDSMILAIDRCYQVDAVKDLRDRAIAFEAYAKQAQNTEAERKATEVRIRAERRAGELLKEMERGQGTRNDVLTSVQTEPKLSEFQEAKRDSKISDTQAKRWQKLAEMPREDFEGKLQDPLVRPTTAGILNGDKLTPVTVVYKDEPRQAPDDALWLWGRLRDFERDYLNADINVVVGQMSSALQSDVRRIVPQLMDWLGELETS